MSACYGLLEGCETSHCNPMFSRVACHTCDSKSALYFRADAAESHGIDPGAGCRSFRGCGTERIGQCNPDLWPDREGDYSSAGPERSQIHSHANRNLMCVTTVWTFHLNPHRSGHFRIVSQSLGYDELFLYLIHHRAAFRAEFKWHCLPPLPGLVWVRKTPFQKL